MTKVTPCTYDMSKAQLTETCPRCDHSAFTHKIEPGGCLLCHVDSTRDDIAEMLEEMRDIMTGFTQTMRSSAPRAGTGSGKLKERKHRHES
jgi:hypothetical protein